MWHLCDILIIISPKTLEPLGSISQRKYTMHIICSLMKYNFFSDLDRFYHFVDRITTPNGIGGDIPEDVFGGLDAMLKLSWPTTGTKVICIDITIIL